MTMLIWLDKILGSIIKERKKLVNIIQQTIMVGDGADKFIKLIERVQWKTNAQKRL